MTPELDVAGIRSVLELWRHNKRELFCGERTNLCLIGVKLYEISFAPIQDLPQRVLNIGHELISTFLYFGTEGHLHGPCI